MTSLKSLKEQAKKLDKKLNKKNPYPPIGFFKLCEKDKMEAFRKKYPNALYYYGIDDLYD